MTLLKKTNPQTERVTVEKRIISLPNLKKDFFYFLFNAIISILIFV